MVKATVDVYNMALGWLGGHQLPNIESASEADNPIALLCRNAFPMVLDEALEAHNWSFATKNVDLAERQEVGVGGYAHRFALPADCLRVIGIDNGALWTDGPNFVLHGNDVLTNIQTPRLLYIARVTEPRLWPAAFVTALSWRLAAVLATANNNDAQKQQFCLQNYNLALAEAWSRDWQSQAPRLKPSPWFVARHGGGE